MNKERILKFYSESCMPCKFMTNVLKEAEIAHESIDIADEKNNQLVMKYGVRAVPTLIKVDGIGNEIDRMVGFPGTKEVERFCNENY